MFKLISLVLVVAFAQITQAQVLNGKSAYREPGVSYKAYQTHAKLLSQYLPLATDRSAVDSAVEFGKATLPKAAAWENEAIMQERFEQFRDLRFLKDSSNRKGLRRSTWLYPDDGCFARAALAVRNTTAQGAVAPSKVFVFGDLNVKTKNAPGGFVTWWYHVAPLVEINGQKYVLDPAIHPEGPLKLEEWLATMSTTPQNLNVSVCNSGSYTPYDSCSAVSDGKEELAEADQGGYLSSEWYRLESLNRNPAEELGDNPPWK